MTSEFAASRHIGALASLGTAVAIGLGGCGDGSSVDSAPTQVTESRTQPATVTLTDYLELRKQRSSALGFASPDASEVASIFGQSRTQAVAMIAGLGTRTNAVVLPPLRHSFIHLLASAAQGETLAELRQAYPAEPGPYAAASQTFGVTRQVWAQSGAHFLPAFLSEIDSFGPLPPLTAWSAFELAVQPWDDKGGWADEKLQSGLRSLHPDLPLAVPTTSARTRLLVADALHEVIAWPEAKIFDGIFQTEGGGRQMLPMLRLSAGVKRHIGSDFNADIVRLGSRWLLVIQPREDFLSAFVANRRLEPVLTEAVQALTSPTLLALPDGEIVLPLLDLALPGVAASTSGLKQAFDEVRADLRGVDGGGTYLQAGDAKTRLHIDAAGLSLSAAQVSTFSFSAKNAFAPGGGVYGSVTTWLQIDPVVIVPGCSGATPNLRSFFFVVLDEQRRVMSLSAIASLAGALCF